MVATEFEFRHRFWIIACIFFLSFFCYSIDPTPLAVFALRLVHAGASLSGPADLALRPIYALGAGLALLAAALRTWATAYLHKDVVFDHALHSERLVAGGPYRYVRNPLYLGGLLLTAGMGLLASRLGFALLTLGLWFFYRRLIGREERALEGANPESFQRFCAAVPRLWPALRARLPAGGGKPEYGQAFLGELFMWGFAAMMIIFTLTEDFRWVAVSSVVIVLLRGYTHLSRRRKYKAAASQPKGD